MSRPDEPNDDTTAEHIAFDEFRNGLPRGRFRVIVNPKLAQRFVAGRVNVVPVAITVVGCGIASALAGYPVVGALLVIGGIFLRRIIKHQAAKILLHLASTQASTYYDATTQGVMEVLRV
jgi:hypothetical protein